jgi:glycerol-3-phosphate dehydrogenase
VGCARQVADLMGRELGWSAEEVDEEVDHYLRRVEAERQSQTKISDTEADEARVQVRDVVDGPATRG